MYEIRMPKLGMDMIQATVVKWLVSEGDEVHKGDPIVQVETEKATVELEAEEDGILRKIIVAEDTVVEAGQILGIITKPGEELPLQ